MLSGIALATNAVTPVNLYHFYSDDDLVSQRLSQLTIPSYESRTLRNAGQAGISTLLLNKKKI